MEGGNQEALSGRQRLLAEKWASLPGDRGVGIALVRVEAWVRPK